MRQHRSLLGLPLLLMSVAVIACGGNSDSAATTTTTTEPPPSAYEQCVAALGLTIASALNSGDTQSMQYTYGVLSPAYWAASDVYFDTHTKAMQYGQRAAQDLFDNQVFNACEDPDVVNAVLNLQPGDDGYQSECLDNRASDTARPFECGAAPIGYQGPPT